MGDTKHDDNLDAKKAKISARCLAEWRVVEVLSDRPMTKSVFLHCVPVTVNVDENKAFAVLILEKKAFDSAKIGDLFVSDSKIDSIVKNDVYENICVSLPRQLNEVKGTLIYPATQKHLDKYRDAERFMICETPEMYEKVHLPYIKELNATNSLNWVYNFLEHKSEAERVIYEDDDFMMAPDLKWSGEPLDQLYVQAIVLRRDVASIRDLRAEHLPLLENLLSKGTAAITKRYGVRKSQLRMYLHYHPSYYHLHVHYVHLKYDAPGISAGKAHLLSDVIDNVRRCGNHYADAMLTYTLAETHPLFKRLTSSGLLNID